MSDLGSALAAWTHVVVKPRTGAGGVGVVVASSLQDERLEGLTAAPWVVQPWSSRCGRPGRPRSTCSRAGPCRRWTRRCGRRRAERDPGARAVRRRSRAVDLGPEQGARRGGGVRGRCGWAATPLRARRHDALGRRVGGQRARADRARPLPRRRPGERGPVRRRWCDPCSDPTFRVGGRSEVVESEQEASFTRWASERQLALLRTAVLLTGDHHRAEDLVQDALAKVAARWGRLRDGAPRGVRAPGHRARPTSRGGASSAARSSPIRATERSPARAVGRPADAPGPGPGAG